MTDLLPAAEWIAKTAVRAVTDWIDLMTRPRDILREGDAWRASEHAAAEAFAETEAAQEVSEPRWVCRAPHAFNCRLCLGDCTYPKTSAATPPAAVDDPAGGAPASAPQPSAGSPPVPAGVSARPKTAAPSAGLQTPGTSAAAVVVEVMGLHRFHVEGCGPFEYTYHCATELGHVHERFESRGYPGAIMQWADHIAAEVSRRIDAAAAAPQFETGLDMGVSVASEFYPQHQKHQ